MSHPLPDKPVPTYGLVAIKGLPDGTPVKIQELLGTWKDTGRTTTAGAARLATSAVPQFIRLRVVPV